MTISKNSRRIAVLAATVGMALGTGLPAANAYVKSQTISVNCNATTVTTGVSITQVYQGAFKIKQNSATDNRRTSWTGRSSNGNELGWKTTSTGETVSWAGVLPSTYTVKAKKYVPTDCAPFNPFTDGSYDVNYTVTSAS